MKEVLKEIEQKEWGKLIRNPSMKQYTTYRVGGVARAIFFPKDVDSLILALRLFKSKQVRYKLLGKGSNLLFSDQPYDGILIKLDAMDEVKIEGTKITVGAGYSLSKLAYQTAKKGLTGLEFACGIPGSIGGALFMNAGAYKSDMGYVVQSVKVLTPDFRIINMVNRECEFHYRTSFFRKHPDYICLEAVLKLKKGKKEAIEAVNKDRKQRRQETQPLEYPSAGSVFRNPEGMFAGKLIEDLGLKGLTKGEAQISRKHANFIINLGNAKAEDIKSLIEFVKDTVKECYGIELQEEQEYVNWE